MTIWERLWSLSDYFVSTVTNSTPYRAVKMLQCGTFIEGDGVEYKVNVRLVDFLLEEGFEVCGLCLEQELAAA